MRCKDRKKNNPAKYRGQQKDGFLGVFDDQLRLAVAAGIRKVNVGTALNVAYTGAVRQSLTPTTTDPRAFLAAGREAISDAVAQLCLTVAGERVAR